jgi:FKBP-type peptidyl-prolyl cis-trans isomerase FkpA
VLLLQWAKKIIPLILTCFLLSECTGEKIILKPSGILYVDNKSGEGRRARTGDQVTLHFKAWLIDGARDILSDLENDPDAVKLGDSYLLGKPVEFKLEENNFIRGSDEGIAGMSKGGIRTIVIPSEILYKNSTGDYHPDMKLSIKLIIELLQID